MHKNCYNPVQRTNWHICNPRMVILATMCILLSSQGIQLFKDTDKEKALSNKIPALAKSKNMRIWVVGTSINSL